jgi:5-methylcytosine-specific restriction endonuclease McrA
LKNIAKIRKTKFLLQNGECYYCCQPMWRRDIEKFANQHRLTAKTARLFQATAEHLIARSDGGADMFGNIVAACWFCNTQRHRTIRPLSPDIFARKVRSRLRRGKWHGFIEQRDAS